MATRQLPSPAQTRCAICPATSSQRWNPPAATALASKTAEAARQAGFADIVEGGGDAERLAASHHRIRPDSRPRALSLRASAPVRHSRHRLPLPAFRSPRSRPTTPWPHRCDAWQHIAALLGEQPRSMQRWSIPSRRPKHLPGWPRLPTVSRLLERTGNLLHIRVVWRRACDARLQANHGARGTNRRGTACSFWARHDLTSHNAALFSGQRYDRDVRHTL